MKKTLKVGSKTYRVIQPGEHFDGKALYDEAGKKVRGPYLDPVKAEQLSRKRKRAKKKGAK